jgi:site-specific DNA recombinase
MEITGKKLAALGTALGEAMRNGDAMFRKAYLRLFIDRIVVGDTDIWMRGPKATLAKAAISGGLPLAGGVVPSFVRQWRPVRDSNSCYRREREAMTSTGVQQRHHKPLICNCS